MTNPLEYEWDEEKRQTNLNKHGVDFQIIEGFNWETALVSPDNRYDYNGEQRYLALGLINYQVYRLSFTHRGEKVRVINLRKANKPEVKYYVRQI